MIFQLRAFAGLVLMGSATLLTAGGPCKSTPVSVAISPTYNYGGTSASSMIFPDSSAPYVEGVAGVGAIINTTCTNDLILDLNNSARKIGFSFQHALATHSDTPGYTAAPFLANGAYLVVGNLMYNYSSAAYYQFTTIAGFSFTPPGGRVQNQDTVCFGNPAAQVYTKHPCFYNSPFTTSMVVVTHTPADSLTGAVETWTITPDHTNMNPAGSPVASQVAQLALGSGKNGNIDAGQFSMPFQFTVTRK